MDLSIDFAGPTAVIETCGLILSMLFLVFLPFELLRLHRSGRLTRTYGREMLASLSPLLPTLLLAGLTLSFIVGLYTTVAQMVPWSIPSTPLHALLCVLLVDFLYYIDHRCAHRVRAYWAIAHSVHHSSPQYDQTTAFRVSAIDGFLSPWFYLPALLIGFEPLLVGASLAFILGYQQWLHTETIDKLRLLDPWLNTPSNHRVHHGSQPEYLDKNYGAVLMIWDRIFGSYAAEREPVRYGLTVPIASSHPVTVHLHELRVLCRDLRRAQSWQQRWQMLWQAPGWTPAAGPEKSY